MSNLPQYPTKISPAAIHDLVQREDPIILEIGAHDGSDTLRLLQEMPAATFYCFEPDPRPARRFRQSVSGPRVWLFQEAVGATDGTIEFYPSTGRAGGRADWDYSGSIRQPTGHLIRSPEIKFGSMQVISVTSLDTWATRWLDPEVLIDFAWVDIQGAQRDFIRGAQATLVRVQYIYIECHSQPLYNGEPSQDELIDLLPGFHPLAIYEGENILFARSTKTL